MRLLGGGKQTGVTFIEPSPKLKPLRKMDARIGLAARVLFNTCCVQSSPAKIPIRAIPPFFQQ